MQLLLNRYALTSLDELYIRIGEGRIRLKEVIENIKDLLYGGVSPLVTPTGAFNKIELTTLDPVSVNFPPAANPIPVAKDNCALLTLKGLSVHHKNCERFREIDFQREEAVDITWNIRQTHVSKPQIIHILRATRKEIMEVVGRRPGRDGDAEPGNPVQLLFHQSCLAAYLQCRQSARPAEGAAPFR